MTDIFQLPLPFFISLTILVGLSWVAWQRRREAWGIPAIAVCGTVVVWYHLDAIYNGYDGYQQRFSADVLDSAWWQVCAFAFSLAVLTPWLSRTINARNFRAGSKLLALADDPQMLERLQPLLKPLFAACMVVWSLLSLIALVKSNLDWQGLFAPWLGHKADVWGRGRMGGSLGFLFALISYTYILCLSTFGVTAALARSPHLKLLAFALVLISWPYVLMDRARNIMLAVVLPCICCLVFLRFRRRPMIQIGILVAAFLAMDFWFSFVLSNRTGQSVAGAFASRDQDDLRREEKHAGLNMFEELCWITKFLGEGSYEPNWGFRYFAELVNPVPRAIWPGKPTIGLDYAVARGQGSDGGEELVHATISTGMIGQGVVNFGGWLGPPAAALLMAVWVAMLARLDLTLERFGHLPLYLLGLALTFNLGRDITFLVAFPLFVGYGLSWLVQRWTGTPASSLVMPANRMSATVTERARERRSR